MQRTQTCYEQWLTATLLLLLLLSLPGTTSANNNHHDLSQQLKSALRLHAPAKGPAAFLLPNERNYRAIPQDRINNPITPAKVRLGKLLFHETGVGTETTSAERTETYSCATCHHAGAGFKSGIVQGIGDGGHGFARKGSKRRMAKGMNPEAPDGDPSKPDIQPVTSPAALNAAYQNVMLWDGALGNANGSVNSGAANLFTVGPPELKVNEFGLHGLETQVLAGTRVHRLRFDNKSILQTNKHYKRLYRRAFPDGDTGYIPPDSKVTPEALGAAKAIAAYERTLLANRAPFQRWLRGKRNAMTTKQLKGALLFFGKANCVSCHTGPALSSAVGANETDMFFNVGFKDLDTRRKNIHGTVPEDVRRGRGNFTGKPKDDFKFKIPQLYNLKDTSVFGHGGSFKSIKQVLLYKNRGKPQKRNTRNLADEFQPLGLNSRELRELEAFLKTALYDPHLSRYQPRSIPSGNCFPAGDIKSAIDLRCW